MKLLNASYTDYRNLSELTMDFAPGITILWGNNAQGKSNIVEGIYYFARGKSFRNVHDRDLIKFGSEYALCSINYVNDQSSYPVNLSMEIPSKGKKKLFRNGAKLTNTAEMLGSFRAVLFGPTHLSMVNGGPGERRSFLNIAIAQISPSYIYFLSNYGKFLSERNALLKRASAGGRVSVEEWETYAEHMGVAAGEICKARYDYTVKLMENVSLFFKDMTSGEEEPEIRYDSDIVNGDTDICDKEEISKSLFNKLTSSIEKEISFGSTMWGPHRDDLEILLNNKQSRLFSSQGQQRSLALSMKLAEGEISKKATGEYPVFLLDDVFSELDVKRRNYILGELKDRQIIVTSCEHSVIPDESGYEDLLFYNISGGNVI